MFFSASRASHPITGCDATDYYAVYGETGGGRLLLIVGEFLLDGRCRPFAARDMEPKERRHYRKGK